MFEVFVDAADDEVARDLECVVAEAGFELVDVPEGADIALIDARDFEDITRLTGFAVHHPDTDVLALTTHDQAVTLPEKIADIVLPPCAHDSVLTRLKRLAHHRGSPGAQRREMLATAVESCGDIVEICSTSSVLHYVNPAFTRVLGFSRQEALGKTPAQLFRSGMHDSAYYANVEKTLNAGRVWSGVLISKAKAGHLVHLETTISPVKAPDGSTLQFVVVKRDITERLASEARLNATMDELTQARDAALQASRVKSQFLASMSHELRTPLNAIIGYSEMLEEDAIDEGLDHYVADLGKVKSAGKHLLGLINDILDLSKIEAGKMEIVAAPFEVAPMLEEVVSAVQPLATERGNRLVAVIDDDAAKLILENDELRMRQIVFNLVSNGNKFTKNGHVEVRLACDEDLGECTVRVTDTGIGMDGETLGRLFQPFVQADASTTREYGGTGLGLTITKRFAHLMGGRIEVESEPGKGSAFTVHLPLAALDLSTMMTSTPEPEEPASMIADDARVLVIDDEPAVHELLGRAFSGVGITALSAIDGTSGLEMAKRLEPDAIVLDIVMEGMNGYEVLDALKNDERTQDIPVVILSMTDDRATGLALGATDYLIKPVQPSKLVALVAKQVGVAGAKVLLVEDDPPTRELMRRALAGAGHTVHEAENGAEGLTRLEAVTPDLIVLDLMMPVIDGFEFLDRLRGREKDADIPTIVVTAKTLASHERERLRAASVPVIAQKPDSRHALMQLVASEVRRALRRREADVVSERP